jgi:hypothetical protein
MKFLAISCLAALALSVNSLKLANLHRQDITVDQALNTL